MSAPMSAPTASTPTSEDISAPTAPASTPAAPAPGHLDGVTTAVTDDGRAVPEFRGNMDIPWGEGPEARDTNFDPDFTRFGRDSQQSAATSLSRSPANKPAETPKPAPKVEPKKKEEKKAAPTTPDSDDDTPKNAGCSLRSQIIGCCLVAGGFLMMGVAFKACGPDPDKSGNGDGSDGPPHSASNDKRSLRSMAAAART